MPSRVPAGVLLVLGLGLSVSAASAQPQTEPITHREWAIDLYDGVAIGSTKVVGMGGTAMAHAEGAEGGHANPATAGLRRATARGSFAWDFSFDALTARYSTDHDNNGEDGTAGSSILYSALQLQLGRWALVSSVLLRTMPLAATTPKLTLETSVGTVGVVRRWNGPGIAIGLGWRFAGLRLLGDRTYFSLEDSSAFAGAAWAPPGRTWRLGAALTTTSEPDTASASGCDPENCMGLVLPRQVRLPWRASVGGALRLGPTAWNTSISSQFRDERALTLAADLVITGASEAAYGLEAFGQNLWQRSGRHTAWSPRLGAELEAVPGVLRVRGGLYWEPARFVGIDGRAHVTASFELRMFHVWFLGRRRLAFTGAADLARRYNNLGISIGLWR